MTPETCQPSNISGTEAAQAVNVALAERVRELLDYNPSTGEFTWKIPHGRSGAGQLAGSPNGEGYIGIKIDGKLYAAHRLAWLHVTGSFPRHLVDHINGIRTDNRFANLRQATNSQNQANAKRPVTNTSGFKGVSFIKRANKWQASIRFEGRQISLGRHRTPEAAHQAYLDAATRYHGEFARAK